MWLPQWRSSGGECRCDARPTERIPPTSPPLPTRPRQGRSRMERRAFRRRGTGFGADGEESRCSRLRRSRPTETEPRALLSPAVARALPAGRKNIHATAALPPRSPQPSARRPCRSARPAGRRAGRPHRRRTAQGPAQPAPRNRRVTAARSRAHCCTKCRSPCGELARLCGVLRRAAEGWPRDHR